MHKKYNSGDIDDKYHHNKSQNRMEEQFWDFLYHLFIIYIIYINSLLFGVVPEAETTHFACLSFCTVNLFVT